MIDREKIKKIFYTLYVALLFLFVGGSFLAPLIAFQNENIANIIYDAYAPTCHQKLSRSFCVFNDKTFFVGDCTPQSGIFLPNDNKITKTKYNGETGYKIAICSRDLGLYGAMLITALVYPFFRKWDSEEVPPAIYFIIAIIPLALDGSLQLLGTLNIIGHYESTNIIRFVTGALAGIAVTIYLIPLGMHFIGKK